MEDINREVLIEQIDYNIDIEEAVYSIEITPTSTYEVKLNEQGPQGARGYTGNGIASIELTSTVGLVDTYTVTYTDGDTYTFNVTNGKDGIDGQDGTSADITSVTASVDANVGTPSVDVTLGGSSLARTIDFDFHNLKGEPGQDGTDGTDGVDGFSPIATVTQTVSGATITITDKDGTTTADITNGIDGTDGQDGAAATISVGTVTTGNPGTNASVINSGTSSAAVFDFTIPRGDKGDTGSTGATGNGIVNTEYISSVGLVDTYHINYTNGNYDVFTVTNGQNGSGSVADVLVNGTSVLDGQDAKILIKTINSNSITGSGNLDVGTVTSVNNITPVSGNVTISIPTDTSDLTNNAGFITSSALSGYATETWVGNQGYITGITSDDVTTALGYTPLSDATKYGSSLSYLSNVLQLLDQDGNSLGSSVTIQSSPDIDNKSITTNLSDELQTVGVIDQNNTSTAIKTWTGTRAQYDAIVSKDANTLYNITDDTDVTLTLLNALYPVGSIYIGTMANCPLATLGVGTWQLVATDRVLQGATDGSVVGTTVEAGLPNITGAFKQAGQGDTTSTFDGFSGAFYNKTSFSGKYVSATGTSGTGGAMPGFDASRSSSIYGNSNTVQPPAYLVNIWERTA